MKLSKSEIIYLGQLILTWIFINITANMFGLWFSKLLNQAEFTYLDSITNEFIKPLAIQSVIFTICTVVAFLFIKTKKLSLYIYTLVQFVIFHCIFLLNLKFANGIHYQTTFNNLGLKYLSNSGQYLIDVLYIYFPITGNFENGMFIPANLGTFYIHWILLTSLYYGGLKWVSIKTSKIYFENSKL